VLNWSISRNHKEILNSTKISVTPGMYVTQGDSVQRPLTSGPRGWPTGQLFSRFRLKLLGCVSTQEGKGYDSGESQWMPNSLASRPCG
jgi:hypothetical protein